MITLGCTGRGTALPARTGSASRSRFRAIRCGRRSRTPSACRARSVCRASGTRSASPAGGISGCDSLWLLNGLVFYVLLFTTGQWRRVVPTTWAVFPNAAVGADPVPVVALADRERMGRVQQSSTARVLHHDLRCRTARAHHRARHVTGTLDPLQAGQQAAEHPDGTIPALPGAGLVPACSS